MKLLLIGPQGCGKGTQGDLLSRKLGIPLVSVGQILRELPESHPKFKLINEAMAKGELAPQAEVALILKDLLSSDRYSRGYIMDGWGRVMEDLRQFDPHYDKVIYVDIPKEESIKRLSTRRTCTKCGAVYNIETLKPKISGVCDLCGAELYQRTDDIPETIERRLEIFNNETQETLSYFEKEGVLLRVDGTGTPAEVFELIIKALNLK